MSHSHKVIRTHGASKWRTAYPHPVIEVSIAWLSSSMTERKETHKIPFDVVNREENEVNRTVLCLIEWFR